MRKRMTAILLVAGLTAFSLTAFADEKDDRIQELEEQIVEMQQTIDDLQKFDPEEFVNALFDRGEGAQEHEEGEND